MKTNVKRSLLTMVALTVMLILAAMPAYAATKKSILDSYAGKTLFFTSPKGSGEPERVKYLLFDKGGKVLSAKVISGKKVMTVEVLDDSLYITPKKDGKATLKMKYKFGGKTKTYTLKFKFGQYSKLPLKSFKIGKTKASLKNADSSAPWVEISKKQGLKGKLVITPKTGWKVNKITNGYTAFGRYFGYVKDRNVATIKNKASVQLKPNPNSIDVEFENTKTGTIEFLSFYTGTVEY